MIYLFYFILFLFYIKTFFYRVIDGKMKTQFFTQMEDINRRGACKNIGKFFRRPSQQCICLGIEVPQNLPSDIFSFIEL